MDEVDFILKCMLEVSKLGIRRRSWIAKPTRKVSFGYQNAALLYGWQQRFV
jgi:hypothetical protein